MNDAADQRRPGFAAWATGAARPLATLATIDSGGGPPPAGSYAERLRAEFERAMMQALAHRPRTISPKFFYDSAGSELFETICGLPEYYPTRTEVDILRTNAREIARCVGPAADLVEFGAGSTRKIRVLLDALDAPRRFVPIDISSDHLGQAMTPLARDYPGVEISPLAADFTRPFVLPPALPRSRRVGFFAGSSLGNFSPRAARELLEAMATCLRGGGLLLGVDLVKDPAMLHAAYNDAEGITAAFNRNVLVRANRELGTDFEPDGFAHYAFYDPRKQRIEMHLLALADMTVRMGGLQFDFGEGESLHTENSYKFSVDGVRALARQAGFRPGPVWCDRQRLFSIHWLSAPE